MVKYACLFGEMSIKGESQKLLMCVNYFWWVCITQGDKTPIPRLKTPSDYKTPIRSDVTPGGVANAG